MVREVASGGAMGMVRVGGKQKGGKQERQIIPSDFFLDLYNEVDTILDTAVTQEVDIDGDVDDQFKSKPKQKPGVAPSPGKPPSPWVTHPSFNEPLFTEENAPTPASTRFGEPPRGMAEGRQEPVTVIGPKDAVFAPGPRGPVPAITGTSSAPPRPRPKTAPSTVQPGDAQVESMSFSELVAESESPSVGARDGGAGRFAVGGAAPQEKGSSKATASPRPKESPRTALQVPRTQSAGRRRPSAGSAGRLSSQFDWNESPTKRTEQEMNELIQQASASAETGLEPKAPNEEELDDLMQQAAEFDRQNATLRVPQADAESTSEIEAFAPAANRTAVQQKPTRPPLHKYEFRSGERLGDIRAKSYEEALGRLRQFLLMKYGSYRRAFYRLEEAIDLTGVVGLREDDVQHVSGMLMYREFINAVKTLIPNWAEITGIGSLGRLFKAIDDNDSGYINFEELMGCKVDDEMANHEFDFCPRRPMKHCPFRKVRNFEPWSHHQNRTNGAGETFQATLRHTDPGVVLKALAPKFVPIWEMPVHHHEEDDGGSSMSSDAHSSEQELDLDHIKLRLRGSGLSVKINWRKVFEHYDHRHTGEINWFEFRSIVRKDVMVTPDILTERDLKELFYSYDVVKEALGDSIMYERLLEWLEPKPTAEELAMLKRERADTMRHANLHKVHKTAFVRTLEVERRHVAADHHSHMSCNPCTKLCPICKHIILVSSWAGHKYGCARKQRNIVQKEQDEIKALAKCNFTPRISKKAKFTQGIAAQSSHDLAKRFPIRARRNEEKHAENHERVHGELTFKPNINPRSRDIHKLVHEERTQELHTRLANPTPRARMVARVESKKDAEKAYTPQITVRGVQKGFERGAENVFHRLHHGPKEIAVFTDPGTEKEEHEVVQHTTDRLMKCVKPIGISESAWEKVKQTQQITCEDVMSKRRAEELEREISPSPASAGFLADVPFGGSPSTDMFSPRVGSLISPSEPRIFSARSSAPGSVSAQPPFSARTVSSAATRSTTPAGAVFSTKGKDFPAERDDDIPGDVFRSQVSPSSTAFQVVSPGEGVQEDGMDLGFGEFGWEKQQVVGTHKVMALLERCDEVVKMRGTKENSTALGLEN